MDVTEKETSRHYRGEEDSSVSLKYIPSQDYGIGYGTPEQEHNSEKAGRDGVSGHAQAGLRSHQLVRAAHGHHLGKVHSGKNTLVDGLLSHTYPISALPEHIHSTILSYRQNYLKTHTQTMETSFHPPLTLVSLLANYPHSHYLPPHWGSHLHTPLDSHSIFWRHGSNISCAASCTFVLFPFCFGSKVTGVYHASFY